MLRDEKHIKLGFFSYQKFYQLSSPGRVKEKTYKEFINSPYFAAFVEFGKYLLSINAIEQEGFICTLIKNGVKLDQWTDNHFYESWIRELGKKESPEKAIERNVLLAQSWATVTGEDWTDFFRKVNPQLATKWTKSGRISPWLLYSEIGAPLLLRLSDEQLTILQHVLDPVFWQAKIEQNKNEITELVNILKSAGI